MKTINPNKKITITKNKKGIIIRTRVQTINEDPSLTDQSQEKESNVNYIMQKYSQTGILPELRQSGYYADLTNLPDLSQALQTVTTAQQAFDTLPSDIRARFGNSPASMLEFLNDSANKDEAIKLGLINPPEAPPEPIKVKVIPDPPSEK